MDVPGGLERGGGPGRGGGFTILEIMIATAILTLGLVGILALFPVAIFYGKVIVEKSTAVVVGESVAEAIREGLRNNLRYIRGRNNATYTYFVFRHDGVKDRIPARTEEEKPDKDYYVLLPRFGSTKELTFSSRDAAMRAAKTFVYPETDRDNPNGRGDASAADNDGDDLHATMSDGQAVTDIFVEKTYELGDFLPGETDTGETVLDDQKIESFKQYSYAFEIQASREDANLSWNAAVYQPANRLYRVRVLVYRGFIPPAPGKPQTPVFELDFEVAL